MKREPRFGVITIQNVPWPTLLERWQYLEELGFDSAWVADHFTNYREQAAEPWLECWTLLSALAASTERIRVGTLVTNITFHNPAVLARQALTVDHVSGGRLELGIGAGGARSDHDKTGVHFWDPPERAARLREFTEIVDHMLRNEKTTYRGRYYTVEDADMSPPPVQRPRPPLTLAAWGPKTLRVAAENADSWNFVPVRPELTPEQNLQETARRNEMPYEYCSELGRDPAEIIRSLLLFPRASDTPFDSDEAFQDFVGRYREIGIDEFILLVAGGRHRVRLRAHNCRALRRPRDARAPGHRSDPEATSLGRSPPLTTDLLWIPAFEGMTCGRSSVRIHNPDVAPANGPVMRPEA